MKNESIDFANITCRVIYAFLLNESPWIENCKLKYNYFLTIKQLQKRLTNISNYKYSEKELINICQILFKNHLLIIRTNPRTKTKYALPSSFLSEEKAAKYI